MPKIKEFPQKTEMTAETPLKSNAPAVRKALREAFGVLNDRDVKRIKKLRKNWDKRIKELWGE